MKIVPHCRFFFFSSSKTSRCKEKQRWKRCRMCFQGNWVFVYTWIIRILKFSHPPFPPWLRKWMNVLFSTRGRHITAPS
jgi:hypothetical protein